MTSKKTLALLALAPCVFAVSHVHADEQTDNRLVQVSAQLSKIDAQITLAKTDDEKHALLAQKLSTQSEKATLEAKKTKEAEDAKKQAEDAEKARIEGLKNPQYTNQETNSYPQLQCTWGAKVLAPWAGDHWGNGGMWAASAASEGFVVDTTPEIGSLICFTEGEFGHIAYVKDVNPDNGQIQILEANYGGSGYQADPRGIGNYRGWFTPQGNIHYIHNKKA